MFYEVEFYLTEKPTIIKKLGIQAKAPSKNVTIKKIDLSTFYDKDNAILADLSKYIPKAVALAWEDNEMVLTGRAPVWLYLAVAHVLHGKAKKLSYNSPVTGDVVIFNHDPF